MSDSVENPETIAKLLKRLSPEELAQVRVLLDDAKGDGSPLSVNIGGHVIGCSIGTGASLNAKDIITALEGMPTTQAQRSATRFNQELVKRHLADVEDPEFARTTFHKKMGYVEGNRVVPLRMTAIFFAFSPKPLFTAAEEPTFIRWADCNKLRYEPCKRYPFLRGVHPDRIGSALVWSDGAMNHGHPGYVCCTQYLALERVGWIEMGLSPVDPTAERHELYYAQLVANLVGFLGLIRDIAAERKLDPAAFSLGVGLRGIRGANLTCLTQRLMRGYAMITPPERDAMLFLRASEDEPWEVDGVAHDFADSVLDYWEFARPGWLAHPPEFDGGVYKGEFFRDRFDHW